MENPNKNPINFLSNSKTQERVKSSMKTMLERLLARLLAPTSKLCSKEKKEERDFGSVDELVGSVSSFAIAFSAVNWPI